MESFTSKLPSPVRHALESFWCLQYVLLFLVYAPFSVILFVMTVFSPLFFLPLLYGLWYLYDKETPYRAGRGLKSWRSLSVWRLIGSYFPITLHKTADLVASKNYIFAHHPHGVLGVANFVNFATDATNVSEKFPGLSIYPLTLDINFLLPVLRDFILALNMGAVSAESIIYKLTKVGPGKAVALVVGGAAEAEYSDPNEPYRLKLKDRKGFVKMALKTGASLVPVFSFGETSVLEVYRPDPLSFMAKFQSFVHKNFTFVPMVFYGRFFVLPHRYPINTVVGSPIDVPLTKEPTQSDIDKYHSLYINALQKLFDENVKIYGNPAKKLELL